MGKGWKEPKGGKLVRPIDSASLRIGSPDDSGAASHRPPPPPAPRRCLPNTLSHLALRRHACRPQARQATSIDCIRSLCSRLMAIYPT